MFDIFMSAIWRALQFVFQGVLIKFGVFTALYYLTVGLISMITDLLPTSSALSALGNLSSDMWYFLDVFAVSAGIPMIITAAVTRFMIRRIPVIG